MVAWASSFLLVGLVVSPLVVKSAGVTVSSGIPKSGAVTCPSTHTALYSRTINPPSQASGAFLTMKMLGAV